MQQEILHAYFPFIQTFLRNTVCIFYKTMATINALSFYVFLAQIRKYVLIFARSLQILHISVFPDSLGRSLSGFGRANFLRIRSQPDWSSYFQPVLSLATASWSPFWKVVFLHRWLCGKGWEFKCLAGPDKFMIYLMNLIVEPNCTLLELSLANIANLCRLCKITMSCDLNYFANSLDLFL